MKNLFAFFLFVLILLSAISSTAQNVMKALPLKEAKPYDVKDNPYVDLSPILDRSVPIPPITYTRAPINYETIFNVGFDSKNNPWTTANSELRKSQVRGGKLFDYFAEKGYVTSNLVSANFNKSENYRIRFSIANLNNKTGEKYQVLEKKKNGKFKTSHIDNPVWGFVWGFKNWDNYHAILFQKVEGQFGTTIFYTVYSKIGGNKIEHEKWQEDYQRHLTRETDFNEIIIEKLGNKVYFYSSRFGLEKMLGGSSSSEWLGQYMGPYIAAGANICLDLLIVERAIK